VVASWLSSLEWETSSACSVRCNASRVALHSSTFSSNCFS
jgi:hypothetical protein